MTRRNTILLLVMFLLLTILFVQALPSAQLSAADESSASTRSSTRPPLGVLAKRTPSKAEKHVLLFAKQDLQVSEDQWRKLKPKLRRIQLLHMQATLGTSLTLHRSSSDNPKSDETRTRAGSRHRSRRVPRHQVHDRQEEANWAWRKRWGKVPITECTHGEKLIDRIIFLLERQDVRPHLFQRQMKALRQYRQQRSEESDKAMNELLKHLTIRQKAVLVLQGWL